MINKKIIIKQLIWDNWNIEHIALHNITPEEVQEVCDRAPVQRERHKNRIFLIGLTKSNRMLTVILEPTEKEEVYKPITAYDASKRSIQDYQEEKKQGGDKT